MQGPVEHDQVRAPAHRDRPDLVCQSKRFSGCRRRHRHGLFDTRARVDHASERPIHGQRAPGDRPVRLARDTIAHLNSQVAERVVAVTCAGRGHRVGDERDSSSARGSQDPPDGGGMQMYTVADQLDGDPVVLEQGRHRARLAV
jgi:hypothetical protein